jgi:hypothetical protein
MGDLGALSIFEWGREAGTEFAILIIALAVLLLILDLLPSRFRTRRNIIALSATSAPLLALFAINIIVLLMI